jgi:hypothetical protein
MRRKIVLLFVAVLAVALIAASLFLITRFVLNSGSGVYEKSIVRNTDNAEEEQALSAAENSDYLTIFNITRFTESGTYTWASCIDNAVINYYDSRFENMKGKPEETEFHYEANVYAWSDIRVVMPENANNDTIRVLSANGMVLFENADYTGPSWGMQFALRNGSEYQKIQPSEVNFTFSKSYVVEMKLRYSEVYAPLAAFYSDVYQIIVVDENYVPQLLCVQSENLIS